MRVTGAQEVVDWVSEDRRLLAASLIELQLGILDDTVAAIRAARGHELAEPARLGAGDVSFKLDLPAEARIERHFARTREPIVIVAEGIGVTRFGGPGAAAWRVILDPVDGTRPLAVTLRSAFSLAGAARDRGAATSLADIELAVQVELPPPKQHLASVLLAERGRGAVEAIWDATEGRLVRGPLRLRATAAVSARGGFAVVTSFFPGTHRVAGALADDLYARVFGDPAEGEAQAYDDQWISTGGQVFALATGRYRFVADLRGLLPGFRGLTCHPYDLCTALIAREAGAIVTTPDGAPLAYPLDTYSACPWTGFGSAAIEAELGPTLRALVDAAKAR